MSDATPRMRLRLGTMLAAILAATVALVAGIIAATNYRLDIQEAQFAARDRVLRAADSSVVALSAIEQRGAQLAVSLANIPTNAEDDPTALPTGQLRDISHLLHRGDGIFSLFVGRPNGAYVELVNLDAAPDLRAGWGAEATDRWVLVSIAGRADGWFEIRRYLSADLVVRAVSERSSDYRANEREWFRIAEVGVTRRTHPYRLALYEARGVSHVTKTGDGRVTGAIVLLSSINRLLTSPSSPQSLLTVMFESDGHVIASGGNHTKSDLEIEADPRFRALLERARSSGREPLLSETTIDGVDYYAFVTGIDVYDSNSGSSHIGFVAERAEVLAASLARARSTALLSLAIAILVLPIGLLAGRAVTVPISGLAADTQHIRNREFDRVRGVRSALLEVNWLSDSLTAMAAAIRDFEERQRTLRDAMVQLIAGAIDQKSPYTGGHCARVPEFAMALADAATRSQDSAFRDIAIDSDDARREFEMAAWLHDCGKITTPEYVVDKGSKLETLYNRIHEVRMRFEVLLRDAEIDYWQQVQQRPEERQSLGEALRATRRELVDEFSFVASCNIGGEYLDEDSIARLQKIAGRTWERRLDDRLGLSPAEELRLVEHPSVTPCTEQLLADKPEHVIPQETSWDDDGFGFTMRPPANKLNLGELHNLSVSRGTLTDEERYLINEHITATIRMLETLPWPQELARVPEIAGGHHEKLDGTGYPRSLDHSELSMAARIIAIADVLEALTAADRPYKKAKPLSVALRILRRMVDEAHLDADLFRLMIENRIHLDYAHRFLAPEQIDEVDEAALLAGLR